MNEINNIEGLVDKTQLKDILSVYAAAINQGKDEISEIQDTLTGSYIDNRGHLILGK